MMSRTLVFAAMVALPITTSADVIDVPDPGAGINTVGDAIAVAATGDTIRIAAGTYTERNVLTIPGVTIEGVGEVILRTPTISCDISTAPALVIDGADGVVLINLRLEGAEGTICGGHVPASGPGTRAISATGAGLILDSCTFVAGSYQSAARFESSDVEAFSCSFQGAQGRSALYQGFPPVSVTTATPGGAGLELDEGESRLVDSWVQAGRGGSGYMNWMVSTVIILPAAAGGAGVRTTGTATLMLEGCTVRGGDGGAPGGGFLGAAGGCGIEGTTDLTFTTSNSTIQGGANYDPPGGAQPSPLCGFGIASAASWGEYE